MELKFISDSAFLSVLIRLFFTVLLRPIAQLNGLYVRSEEILIISLHRLGDSILTLHAIKELKNLHPGQRFRILTFKEFHFIYSTIFDGDDILTCSSRDFFFGQRLARLSLILRLREHQFREVIDISGDTHTASLITFMRVSKRFGISKYHFKNIYDKAADVRTGPHLADIYYDAVESRFPLLRERNYEPFPLRVQPGGAIILAPFASWPEKEWGLRNFSELAARLSAKYPVKLVIEKGKLSDDIIQGFRSAGAEIRETGSISELSDEIKKSSFLFGVDSGPVHLAAFHGLPTLAIYGPTNPVYCKPFGAHHRIIRKKLYCTPESQNYCMLDAGRNCATRDCLMNITPDEVYEEIIRIVREYKLF